MILLNKYEISKHIRYEIESETGKKVLIIPTKEDIPDIKNVLCLSETSLEIWELITNGYNSKEIIEKFCLNYSIAKTIIENDITTFIQELIDNRYIIIKEGCND